MINTKEFRLAFSTKKGDEKMNKKTTMIIASIAIGVVTLTTTAFASITTTTGYDAYKSADKNAATAKSVTANVTASVKDNGSLLVGMDSSVKLNRDNSTMSETAAITTAGNSVKTLSAYMQDGKLITKTSDSNVYNEIASGDRMHRDEKWNDKSESDTRINQAEKIVDALLGNITDNFKLDNNSDGTKDVTFNLSDAQVPAVVNAVLSVAAVNVDNQGRIMHKESPLGIDFKNMIPELTDNIKVTNVSSNAKIDANNDITNQTVNVTITGNDVKGNAHVITIAANVDLSKYNSTTPDKVNLTGKQVKVIEHKGFEGHGNHQ
jgi:hypothetical protein